MSDVFTTSVKGLAPLWLLGETKIIYKTPLTSRPPLACNMLFPSPWQVPRLTGPPNTSDPVGASETG